MINRTDFSKHASPLTSFDICVLDMTLRTRYAAEVIYAQEIKGASKYLMQDRIAASQESDFLPRSLEVDSSDDIFSVTYIPVEIVSCDLPTASAPRQPALISRTATQAVMGQPFIM